MDHLFDSLFIFRLFIAPGNSAVGVVLACDALVPVKERDIPAGKLAVFEHGCKFKMLQHTDPPLPSASIIKAGEPIDKEVKRNE